MLMATPPSEDCHGDLRAISALGLYSLEVSHGVDVVSKETKLQPEIGSNSNNTVKLAFISGHHSCLPPMLSRIGPTASPEEAPDPNLSLPGLQLHSTAHCFRLH